MEYLNFNPQIHDITKIATLKYNVDFRTYDKLFCSKEKAIAALEKNLKKEECIKVIYDNEDLIGMLVAYTHDNQPTFHFSSIKLLIVDILDYFVICDIKKDDVYIAEIAIDENQRSNGYGTKVIKDVIDYAQKITDCNEINSIIGGFHLLDNESNDNEKIVQYLKSQNINTLYPCHCTGLKAKCTLMQHFNVYDVGVGLVFEC